MHPDHNGQVGLATRSSWHSDVEVQAFRLDLLEILHWELVLVKAEHFHLDTWAPGLRAYGPVKSKPFSHTRSYQGSKRSPITCRVSAGMILCEEMRLSKATRQARVFDPAELIDRRIGRRDCVLDAGEGRLERSMTHNGLVDGHCRCNSNHLRVRVQMLVIDAG